MNHRGASFRLTRLTLIAVAALSAIEQAVEQAIGAAIGPAAGLAGARATNSAAVAVGQTDEALLGQANRAVRDAHIGLS